MITTADTTPSPRSRSPPLWTTSMSRAAKRQNRLIASVFRPDRVSTSPDFRPPAITKWPPQRVGVCPHRVWVRTRAMRPRRGPSPDRDQQPVDEFSGPSSDGSEVIIFGRPAPATPFAVPDVSPAPARQSGHGS